MSVEAGTIGSPEPVARTLRIVGQVCNTTGLSAEGARPVCVGSNASYLLTHPLAMGVGYAWTYTKSHVVPSGQSERQATNA